MQCNNIHKNVSVIILIQNIQFTANADNNNGAQVAELLPDAIVNEEVEDVISYLLNNGAKINAVDNYNQTPLNYAAIKGNIDAVTLLLNWSIPSRADIEVSMIFNFFSKISFLKNYDNYESCI